MSLFDLNGKVVAITGGYSHLGAAMSKGLQAAGASVYVLGRSEEKHKAAFPAASEGLTFVKCDISDANSIRNAFSEIADARGSIDILINNAVYVRGQDPLAISDEDWQQSIDGALNSVYRCIREVTPHFDKAGVGKVINISSMYGMVSPDFSVYEESPAFLNPPHYGAAKAGVLQLTRYFAQYLGPRGIQVNAISPGAFPSPEVQKDSLFVKNLSAKTALKRIGGPEDLVGAVVFLSSKASDYITGQNIVVDGGWTIT